MKWYQLNEWYMNTKINPTFIFMYIHLLYGVLLYLLLLSKCYFSFAEIILSYISFVCSMLFGFLRYRTFLYWYLHKCLWLRSKTFIKDDYYQTPILLYCNVQWSRKKLSNIIFLNCIITNVVKRKKNTNECCCKYIYL